MRDTTHTLGDPSPPTGHPLPGDWSGEKLLAHLPMLAAAGGGIAALRRVVLELAVAGRLVEQRPEDGNGSDLRRRIIGERESLKRASTTDETLLIAGIPSRHSIPVSWCWCSLELLTHPVRLIRYGMLMPGPDQVDGPRYVKVRNMKGGQIDVANLPRTTQAIYAKYAAAALARGDLLMSIRGSFGGIALVPDEVEGANITQDSARIAPMNGVERGFLLLVLRSPLCQFYFQAVAKGAAVQGLNIGDIRRTPIPLAPLPEQKRIVAKVDQLMGLIDELEAKQTTKREVQTRFRTSALDALTKAEGREELVAAWKRVEGNFGALFERVESVRDLRQLLLDLAVLGVLVRTGSADGDAPGFAAADVEPHGLPRGWRWSRLEALASHIVDCLHATPRYTESGLPAIRTADVVPGLLLLDRARLIDEEQFQERIRRLEPAEGDIFYSREGERLGIAACVPPGIRVCLSQRMMHIRARAPMHPSFLMWAMNSRFVYRQAVHETGVIPVPPPEVQKRIVAKKPTNISNVDVR